MEAAFGEIEARPAEPARARPLLRREIDAEIAEELHAVGGHFAGIVAQVHLGARDQRSGDADAEMPGEVIVTGATQQQRLVARRPRAVARRHLDGGHGHDALEHAGDERRGQPVVAMAALLDDREEPRLQELGEMRARRRRADPGREGQFSGGEGAAVQECVQNIGARRVADQGGDLGHRAGTGDHRSKIGTRPPQAQGPTLRCQAKRSRGDATSTAVPHLRVPRTRSMGGLHVRPSADSSRSQIRSDQPAPPACESRPGRLGVGGAMACEGVPNAASSRN